MATVGSITDEGIERLRARIGIPEPHPCPPHYLRPDTDAFRHVAECYGDDNPLFCDPEYAAGTRWGGPIAPPAMVGGDTLIGEDEVAAVAPEHQELMKGDPLRGVHAFYAASAREWWAPLATGDPDVATQRARRRARQGVRVRRAGSPRVDRAGVPHRRRAAALRSVPQHGPDRADEGTRAQEGRRVRAGVLQRGGHRRHRRAVRERSAPRRDPAVVGGRRTRATRSDRSSRARSPSPT